MSAETERLLPPEQPAAFESLCLDLWTAIWEDTGAQKNGRNGQPQAGVDIYGRCQDQWMGVQCKQKDGLLWSQVTCGDMEKEVEKAKTFKPALSSFILATSGPASAEVQERARVLTDKHALLSLFTVEVWSWEKIWHELYHRRELLKRLQPHYWPNIGLASNSALHDRVFEAKDMIRRYRLCAANGVESTPEPDRVRSSESEAWYAGTGGVIGAIFGDASGEANQWRKLASKVHGYMDEAIQRGLSACEGYINHLNHCVGLLTDLSARAAELERQRGSSKLRSPVPDFSHVQLLSEQINALVQTQNAQQAREMRESIPIFVWRDGMQTSGEMVCNFQNIGGSIEILKFGLSSPGKMNIAPNPRVSKFQLGSVKFTKLNEQVDPIYFEISYRTSFGTEETKRFSVSAKDGMPREV